MELSLSHWMGESEVGTLGAAWKISLDENHEIVDSLECTANLEASVVTWLIMSLTKEFKMAIALLDQCYGAPHAPV
jgi:hypothetical protein